MKNYIIGSGGFSKEVYFVLKRNNISIDGFVDIFTKKINIDNKIYTTILETDILKTNPDDINLYIGIGSPVILNKIQLNYSKFNFPNLIDKDAKILGNINLGKGNIICCNSIFTTDICVGSFNIFNIGCTVGHDVKISNCNVFNPTCCVSGNVQIGDNNLLGVNCTILENIKITSNNIIGASALVNKDITDCGIYIGIPAKRKL